MISLVFGLLFSRLFVGFVLGAITTFYCLPWIEESTGKLHRPPIEQLVGSGKSNIEKASTTSLPVADNNNLRVQQAIEESNIVMELITAITLSKSQPENELSSDYIVNVISGLMDKDSRIASHIKKRLQDGITNQEAIEIFEQFNALQSSN